MIAGTVLLPNDDAQTAHCLTTIYGHRQVIVRPESRLNRSTELPQCWIRSTPTRTLAPPCSSQVAHDFKEMILLVIESPAILVAPEAGSASRSSNA